MNYGPYETNGIYTPAMVHAAVRRGIKYMDKHCPDWPSEIDLDELDLSNGECCILGQTAECILGDEAESDYPDFNDVVKHETGTDWGSEVISWSSYHGFNIRYPDNGQTYAGGSASTPESQARFEMLQIAWVEAIKERLGVQA